MRKKLIKNNKATFSEENGFVKLVWNRMVAGWFGYLRGFIEPSENSGGTPK